MGLFRKSYRDKYPYINTFFDFKVVKNQSSDVFTPQNKEKPTFDCLKALIEGLPNEIFEISFFDHYHPQWSDPGAYIYVVKKGRKMYYTKANHGWSSNCYPSNSKRICAYILKNWEHNQSGFTINNNPFLKPENIRKWGKSIETVEKIWSTQLIHIKDNIFELNGEFIVENENIKYHTDIFEFDNFDFVKQLDFLKLDKIDII